MWRRKQKSVLNNIRRNYKNLTRNSINPFTAEEIITNLSSVSLTHDELDLLKNGLKFSIPPLQLNKTDIFANFELIHRFRKEDLKNVGDAPKIKAELSHFANSYVYNYQPSQATIKKHRILKRLKSNKSIVTLKPNKGNGIVVLDRRLYDEAVLKLISDTGKFKPLACDVTLKREGQLQRFLRKLKQKGFLNDTDYDKMYPSVSQPGRIYGLPKMHKFLPDSHGLSLKFRPIVSSIGTYNYSLAKYLCNMLTPYLPSHFCTQDSFTFVK